MTPLAEWTVLPSGTARPSVIYWGAIAVGLASLLAILMGEPLIAVAIFLALPSATAALLYPHYIPALVIFVIYTNAAVVAIRFHNVPTVAAGVLPIALLVPWAVHMWSGRRQIVITGTLPLVVAFILIQSLGLPGARQLKEAINSFQVSVMEGLVMYVLVTNVVRTKRDASLAIGGLLIAGCFMGGLSLYQQVTRTFDNNYGGFAQVLSNFNVAEAGGSVRQGRMCGPIGEQNRYAQIMLMLVPLGLSQFWAATDNRRKMVAAIATALCAIGCALAFSRGAAVGFALMLVLMTVMRQLQFRQLAWIGVGLFMLILVVPQYATRLASLGSLLSLTNNSSATGEVDGAIRGRLTVMLAALHVAADYPVLGVGPGMFNYYAIEYGNEGGLRALEGTRAAHNLYLEVAAEHGIPGLLCFLAMVGTSMINLIRMKRWWSGRDRQMEYMAVGYILCLASYLSTVLFLHMSYAGHFWLILALADATSHVGRTTAEEWQQKPDSTRPADEASEVQPC